MPGCCGDVNHTDVGKAGPRLGPGVADAIGMQIAGKVLEGMGRAPAARFGVEGPAALRLTTRHLDLPLRDPPASGPGGRDAMPAGIEGASEDISSRTTSDKGLIEVRKYRDWRLGRFRGTTDRVTVQLLACGDMTLVTLPGEMFVELGLTMRRRSPFGSTLLSTLNGSASYYLPTAEAYAEGGYEVESTPIAAGGAEEIVRCVVANLSDEASSD
jgi:neutral ceramidase